MLMMMMMIMSIELIGVSRLMSRLTVHKDPRQSIPQPPQRRQPGSFSLPVNMDVKIR